MFFRRPPERGEKHVSEMVEFSDFPPEIHQMIVERCDFLARLKLRRTSKSMEQIVDSTKFNIEKVYLLVRFHELDTAFQYRSNGRLKEVVYDKYLEDTKWLANILKKAEIKRFEFTSSLLFGLEAFLTIFKEHLDSPLKARNIKWHGKFDWQLFDLNFLKVLVVCDSEEFDFSLEAMERLKDLDFLSIEGATQATDEFVLSLNATVISLESDNFTPEMVMDLIEKFMERETVGSYFEIINQAADFKKDVEIPDDFIPVGLPDEESENRYVMFDEDGFMFDLKLTTTSVFFEISELDEDDSDSDEKNEEVDDVSDEEDDDVSDEEDDD